MQLIDGVERPIAYLSKALNEHQLKWGISDREGGAAVMAIRRFRPYLMGSQTILLTDHSSLLSLSGQREADEEHAAAAVRHGLVRV